MEKKKSSHGVESLYKHEYDKLAFKYCLLGATDKILAEYFNVTEQTINNWKHDYPSFFESIIKGKHKADSEVAEALYNRARGYTIKLKKPLVVSDGKEMGAHVEEAEQEQHYPPDTAAAFIWLKNRRSAIWKDKHEVEHSGNITIGKPPTVEDAEFPE